MTNSTKEQTKVKGFQPQPKEGPQTEQVDSASTDFSVSPDEKQVLVEVSQVRTQVYQALENQKEGFNTLIDEYHEEAAEFAKDAAYELYDMVSGHSLYRNIAASVGALMGAHPTAQRGGLGKTRLKRVSFTPLKPATTQNLSSYALEAGSDK